MNTKSQAVIKSQRRKKQYAVDQFGGKCQVCGYDRCINALAFHHIDPATKESIPSYIIKRWSWARAKKELEKCILVCSNCHSEIHYKVIDIEYKVYMRPWVDKNCKCCKKEFSTKLDNQLYCSVGCGEFHRRKVKRPTKLELKKLIVTGTAWVQMGKMFGVSDNAVRKWAKQYDLLSG